MAVLDDIRDGKGLKPITSTYFTCQKGMTNIDVLRNASAENFARFLDEYEYHGRTIREWADLISKIPPHGRLIDADALLSLLDKCMFPSDMVTTSAVRMATNWIKDAPTIIPADEPTQSNVPNTLKALTNACPLCKGTLSGLRRSGGHFIRHCYSCNFDFPIDKDGNAIRLKEETT